MNKVVRYNTCVILEFVKANFIAFFIVKVALANVQDARSSLRIYGKHWVMAGQARHDVT